MGSTSSKAARGAARQFPTRAPGAAVPHTAASRARPQAKTLGDSPKDDAVRADAMDPDSVTGDFSKRLQQMGVAEPNPTYSPSSTASPQPFDGPSQPPGPAFPSARNNATLSVLEARRRLQQEAEEDFEAMGRAGTHGRRFIDMRTLVQAMQMRDLGSAPADIEKKLGLQASLLQKLGRPSVLSHAATGASQA